MSYELLTAGYPLPALDIDEKAHLTLAKEFVKSGASHQLYAAVVDNLLSNAAVCSWVYSQCAAAAPDEIRRCRNRK